MSKDSKGRFEKAQAAIRRYDNKSHGYREVDKASLVSCDFSDEDVGESLLKDFLKAFGVALLILIVIGFLCALGCTLR